MGAQALGLVRAAVEGMHDAATHGDAIEVLEQRIGRAAHVHDHRQLEIARDAQLLLEEPLLALTVEAGFVEVDTDLADGDEALVVERRCRGLAHAPDVVLVRGADAQWVDAERVRETVAMRGRAHLAEMVDMAGGNHDHRHATGSGARHDLVTVGVELGRVEMAMGVDPHAAVGGVGCRVR